MVEAKIKKMHASANIVEIKIRWKVGKTFLSFTSVIQDNCKDMILIVIVQKMAFQLNFRVGTNRIGRNTCIAF
jgi:hypothetical protein